MQYIAAEEGILPGGGTALLYATTVLKNLKADNDDQKGRKILKKRVLSCSSKTDSRKPRHEVLLLAKQLKENNYMVLMLNWQAFVT